MIRNILNYKLLQHWLMNMNLLLLDRLHMLLKLMNIQYYMK